METPADQVIKEDQLLQDLLNERYLAPLPRPRHQRENWALVLHRQQVLEDALADAPDPKRRYPRS